jgi:hypothetical protein
MGKAWEPLFPRLGIYEDHSPTTYAGGPFPRYNCWAFAAGETLRRWEPDPSGQYYWPDVAPREYTVPAFMAAYKSIGYKHCANALPERSCEKIVIYATADGRVTHAARQLSDGRWISKLGDAEDIIHQRPESLSSMVYGQPVQFMKRPIAREWTPIHGWFGAIRFLSEILSEWERKLIAHSGLIRTVV